MTRDQSTHLVYLLRLWRVDSSGRPMWRASLENPRTAERRGFADLRLLVAFLEDETARLGRVDLQDWPADLPPSYSAD